MWGGAAAGDAGALRKRQVQNILYDEAERMMRQDMQCQNKNRWGVEVSFRVVLSGVLYSARYAARCHNVLNTAQQPNAGKHSRNTGKTGTHVVRVHAAEAFGCLILPASSLPGICSGCAASAISHSTMPHSGAVATTAVWSGSTGICSSGAGATPVSEPESESSSNRLCVTSAPSLGALVDESSGTAAAADELVTTAAAADADGRKFADEVLPCQSTARTEIRTKQKQGENHHHAKTQVIS